MNESQDVDLDLGPRERAEAVLRVVRFRPLLTVAIVALSLLTAALEGVGLGFLIPITEQLAASSGGGLGTETAIGGLFTRLYATVGVPLTLATVVGGIALVIAIRHLTAFFVGWLEAILRTRYMQALKSRAFGRTLDARVAYFDVHGSEEVLNAIVTQSKYASRVIRDLTGGFKQAILAVTYVAIALYLAPLLTLFAVVLLGSLVYGIRRLFESGLSIGSRVADANERLQRVVQTGTQGIRDIKLFGMSSEVRTTFDETIEDHSEAKIKLRRNRTGLNQSYTLAASMSVFLLIYLAARYTSLSLGALGVYLFAMFRLAPQVSNLNKTLYKIEENLPHLVRTHRFIYTLEDYREPEAGEVDDVGGLSTLRFDDVTFRYAVGGADGSALRGDGSGQVQPTRTDDVERESTPSPGDDDDTDPSGPPAAGGTDERVLDEVSFRVESGEFVAFVGPSGAGKSTIASLVSRLYEPTGGTIEADGVPIDRFDIDTWRSQVAVVRQNPFLFDETLRFNVTVGNRDATQADVEEACELAAVTEFLDELPNGYDTVLGEDGVRLSGGQRQRVAIARALLKDAEVLVLDEATSDLDTTLEARVHDSIEADGEDRMLLVIAHRLSTVVDADTIHYVADGRIVESGGHRTLMDHDGAYSEMYERQ